MICYFLLAVSTTMHKNTGKLKQKINIAISRSLANSLMLRTSHHGSRIKYQVSIYHLNLPMISPLWFLIGIHKIVLVLNPEPPSTWRGKVIITFIFILGIVLNHLDVKITLLNSNISQKLLQQRQIFSSGCAWSQADLIEEQSIQEQKSPDNLDKSF